MLEYPRTERRRVVDPLEEVALVVAGPACGAREPDLLLLSVRPPEWHAHHEQSAWSEDADELADGLGVAALALDVLNHRHRVDDVELSRREAERSRVL